MKKRIYRFIRITLLLLGILYGLFLIYAVLAERVIPIPETSVPEQSLTAWLGSADFSDDELIDRAIQEVKEQTATYFAGTVPVLGYADIDYACVGNNCSMRAMRLEIYARPAFDYFFGINKREVGYYTLTAFSFNPLEDLVTASSWGAPPENFTAPYWEEQRIKLSDAKRLVLEELTLPDCQHVQYTLTISRLLKHWMARISPSSEASYELHIDYYTGELLYSEVPDDLCRDVQ